MKIAIDVTGSIYKGTGVATYYKNLVPNLMRLPDKHQFITFGYSLRRYSDLTLASIKLPIPPRVFEILWNRLHVLPVESLIGEFDLLHAWDYIHPPTQKAKIITTIHDLTPIKFPEHQHPRTIAAYKSGLNWVKKEATAIIADSHSTKQDIVDILKISEKKVHVVYLAAPRQFSNFRTIVENTRNMAIDRARKKFEIEGDYLLSVGTQEPRKNLQNTIKAYEALNIDQPLVIIGRFGWGQKIKPSKGVKLLGFVPDEDLPPLYAAASCFIYPSLYEGFGLPVLEAMAIGCPVVTSDRGSLKEVAGDAAILVNPESVEAIAFGIKVALERAQELSEKGIAQARKFSWEQTAAETMKVYEGLTSRVKKPKRKT
jgi:glycosyltransferase involved in cell wall biosynthesis